MEITLRKWTRPDNYSGPSYPEHYYGQFGRSRDSDCLEESNHAVLLRTLRAVEEDETPAGWQVIRDSHWAVGWIEYVLIHESRRDLLEAVQVLVNRHANYPVLDEDHFSEVEMEAANETWRNCYRPAERVKYIRDHRSQFDFHDWRDVRANVRGEYFSGYASELVQ